jgi:hypothetical protein
MQEPPLPRQLYTYRDKEHHPGGILCDFSLLGFCWYGWASRQREQSFGTLHAGGGHLYAGVVRYLQADMAPRLFGTDAGANNPALFTAAAGLTEVATFSFAEPVFA